MINNDGSTEPEAKTLSSALTILVKALATVWIVGFGLGAAYFWTHISDMRDEGGVAVAVWLKWTGPVVWIVGTFMMNKFVFALKQVRLMGHTLLISNNLKEIRISGNEIKDVTEIPWMGHHPVTIYFRQVTEFGDRITFMPEFRWGSWSLHPTSDVIRKLAAGKTMKGRGDR